MAEQQQQPAGGQVQTASSARVGLARSRHALGNDDETSNKKQKGAAPSFARDWIKKVQGKPHCTHCNESVSTNITRAKLHLLKCRKFLESEAAQAEADNGNKEVQQALLEHSSRLGRQATLTGLLKGGSSSGAGSSAGSGSGSGSGDGGGVPFVKKWPKFTKEDFEEANTLLATAIYCCNLPMTIVEHPDFLKFIYGVAPWMQGKLIGRKALATTMLDKVYGMTRKEVQQFLDKQDFVATSSDAWSSEHNAGAHVLNVNAMANGTSVFLDMVFTGADSHTGNYIATQVEGVLGDWRLKEKTVSFVTDWGSNMMKAGDSLKEMLGNYVGSVNCLQHLISNGLKDFAKNESLASVISKAKEVVQYVTGHCAPRAIYDEKKKELHGTALIKAGATRFGSNVLAMESVERNEKVLRATVGSAEYDAYIQKQSKAADKAAAVKIKGLINDTSSTLFSDTKWAVDTLAPFQSAIKEVEGDTAKLSDAYYTLQVLNKHVKKIKAVQGSLVHVLEDDDTPVQTQLLALDFVNSGFDEAWEQRTKQACTDMVVAAAILDPRYKHKIDSMPPEDLTRGEAFIEKLAGRMFGQEGQIKATAQLMLYKNDPDKIGAKATAVAATLTGGGLTVSPVMFWKDISHSCAELSKVARMLLFIPPASATSERVFSAVGRVWDCSRSRMTSTRVRKLLFIYFNSKALSRDGAVRDAEDFAKYQEWLDSIIEDEEQQQQQQQQQGEGEEQQQG